ncbi:MAG: SPOR domain-containing protein [Burkholderiales bacterium]|nr:SPOR domain-containing protein [Burkholderiales bacterium]
MGIVIGLMLGLIIAASVALFLTKGPKPFADKTARPPSTAAPKGAPNDDPNKPLFGKDAKSHPSAVPKDGKDGEKRFSFYDILPGKEEVIDPRKAAPTAKVEPKAESRADAAKSDPARGDAAKADAKAPAGERYFLQAGAFGSAGDADNQKAKLALMGFEARVESIDIENKGTVYRVRMGPYNRLEDINRIRATLTQNNVDAALIRVREP